MDINPQLSCIWVSLFTDEQLQRHRNLSTLSPCRCHDATKLPRAQLCFFSSIQHRY